MKKGFLTVLLSVLAGGITAYAVVKATEPKTADPSVTARQKAIIRTLPTRQKVPWRPSYM